MSRLNTVLGIVLLSVAACGSEPDAEVPVEDRTPQFAGSRKEPREPKPAPPICAEARGSYLAEREPSNVLFLYDRSGSMHIQLPSKATRWDATKKGFFDLLGKLPRTTAAGLMLFPQGDAPVNAWCGIDASVNDVRCKSSWPEPSQAARCDASKYVTSVSSDHLEVEQIERLRESVSASDTEFYWGTPLASALGAAIAAQRASTLPGAKSVILLTDGNPTSCGESGITNDVSHVVDAAKVGLDGAGPLVRTFVIGLVDSSRQAAKASNLSPVAVAGGTKRAPGCEKNDSCFYKLTDESFADDLSAVFDEVSRQAFDCTFNLPAATDLTDPSLINVQLAGSGTVARDPGRKNGWDYLENGTQIQLYGEACSAMKDEAASLSVVLGCKTIVEESAPEADIDVRAPAGP
ncbi:MAG: hypothetical protein KIT84_28680 [Labilithrix sp.]|nr:hypothetical protein [Labilithrix sp.]MCW5815036.1 hypothetical protein [Labilithrix sp.]